MIATPEALDLAAHEFYRSSDNGRCETTASGYRFLIDEDTGALRVAENDNFMTSQVWDAGDWFRALAELGGVETDNYDIVYLKIAIKERQKARLEGRDG